MNPADKVKIYYDDVCALMYVHCQMKTRFIFIKKNKVRTYSYLFCMRIKQSASALHNLISELEQNVQFYSSYFSISEI